MATNTKSNPRKMMEKAIEVMRLSIPEERKDGKPNPLVGAVLLRQDGTIETAARGELREGNHAEFTLLERKCIGEKLEGAVLFATLEPCLNRNHPKRGCARHIVSARIKTVWVGIEDDNPAVKGKGIEYLRQHGVTVHMFDLDLQEIILEENKNFFEWARQQLDKPEELPIKLSKYEDPIDAVTFGDLSKEALKSYQTKSKISVTAGSSEFHRLLLQQGILVHSEAEIVPSGFGLALFGKEPSFALPQSRLLARAELADGTSTRKEFGQALVFIPNKLEMWLKKILPSTLDRNQMERREKVDLPFEMIREAVVNALIHRDYNLEGQKCQLVIGPDLITIKSPGGPIPPITLEQMQTFNAPIKSRNPILHYVFARMGMAEEQGFGLTSLKKYAEELGLPLPTYSMEGDSLVLTIYRSKASATATLGKDVLESLSKSERMGWQWLATRETTSSSEYAESLTLPYRTAMNHLKRFQELGLLEKYGAGPATEYRIIRE